jgi:2-oxoisovalerate dehydrogenase E1 component
VGAENMPAVPLNIGLEKEMLPNKDKVEAKLRELLSW